MKRKKRKSTAKYLPAIMQAIHRDSVWVHKKYWSGPHHVPGPNFHYYEISIGADWSYRSPKRTKPDSYICSIIVTDTGTRLYYEFVDADFRVLPIKFTSDADSKFTETLTEILVLSRLGMYQSSIEGGDDAWF